MESDTVTTSPSDYSKLIFEYSGHKVEPEVAKDLWPKILKHKWALSEKLGRDVGIKVACLDLVENVEPLSGSACPTERIQILKGLEAQLVDKAIWETISESQPPKQIVDRRIVIPLTKPELARKHGVIPPRTIIFFGPPGTGKTHFVKAIAGRLQWWYVEVSPSTLMVDGEDRLGANLKKLMEVARNLDEVVLFIDEFEEIAGSRDQASRIDKSITNEFLKQLPLLKREPTKNLLVCATNYIRQLDAALLRPGRFDCVIPVGQLDHASCKIIFEHYLTMINRGDLEVDRIVPELPHFTPADIEYLFQKVSHFAFERELSDGQDYRVTTETFLEIIPQVNSTLSDAIVQEHEKDCAQYTRY
jgi:transitional endoplasmic reticulum ATPase